MKLKKRKTEVDIGQSIVMSPKIEEELALHKRLYTEVFDYVNRNYNDLFTSIDLIKRHINSRTRRDASKSFSPVEIHSFSVLAKKKYDPEILNISHNTKDKESFMYYGIRSHIYQLLHNSYSAGHRDFYFSQDSYPLKIDNTTFYSANSPDVANEEYNLSLKLYGEDTWLGSMYRTKLDVFFPGERLRIRSINNCSINFYDSLPSKGEALSTGDDNRVIVHSKDDFKRAKDLLSESNTVIYQNGDEVQQAKGENTNGE